MSALDPAVLEPHRATVWGLGYRMLGVAADADDLVQDTFVRALERPPRDTARALRPWLIRVAANLARDKLRRRRRRGYTGPWLPPPIDELASRDKDPERRVGEREQARYGLLVALERLTPQQRAVWVLRESLGLTGAETAAALDTSESAVKVALHRARARLADAHDCAPPEVADRVVAQLLAALAAGDARAVAALCRADVESHSDGGGRFQAATRVVRGPAHVATLLTGLREKQTAGVTRFLPGRWMGCPGVYLERRLADPRAAPRSLVLIDVDGEGRVRGVYSVHDDGTGKLSDFDPG